MLMLNSAIQSLCMYCNNESQQREGVQFIYANVINSVAALSETVTAESARRRPQKDTEMKTAYDGHYDGLGAGCVLAHCMGLGKTLQACSTILLYTVLYTVDLTLLVISRARCL
jgi:SNF2 family DNA or RNA helicase